MQGVRGMALYLTWGALPAREELPPQAWGWGSKPQILLPLESRDGAFPSTTAHTHTRKQTPSIAAQLLILAAEVPLSSATLSLHTCQGNEVLPFFLGTSDKPRHLG